MHDLRAGTVLLPAASEGAPVRSARGWVLVAAPVLTVILFVVVLIVAAVAAMLAIKPMPSPAAVQAFARQMETSSLWVQGLTILQDLILVFVIWLLLPKRGPAAMSGYFARVSPLLVASAAITGVLLALAVSYGYGLLELRHVVTFHETAGERALVPHSAPELAPGFITIALVAPFAEELYFRGVLLRWLRTKMHVVLGGAPERVAVCTDSFALCRSSRNGRLASDRRHCDARAYQRDMGRGRTLAMALRRRARHVQRRDHLVAAAGALPAAALSVRTAQRAAQRALRPPARYRIGSSTARRRRRSPGRSRRTIHRLRGTEPRRRSPPVVPDA